MRRDSLRSARAVREPVANTYQAEEAFDVITYIKGAAVVGMLEHWLGEEKFRAGIQSYLKEHRWSTATAPDMARALSSASGEKVGPVMSSFVDKTGVPLVELQLDCSGKAEPAVTLRQKRYNLDPKAPADTTIPNKPTAWHVTFSSVQKR